MSDIVTATGLVATELRNTTTSEGLHIVSFRLASSQRRFNKSTNSWEYGPTNWFTVSTFRSLADNVAASVAKGDRVVVTGRLRIRGWEKDGKSGTIVEIDAEGIGHDLMWGTARFSRTVASGTTSGAVGAAGGGDTADSDSGFDPDEGRAAGEPAADGWATAAPGALAAV